MATRRESVTLSLVDAGFSTGMAKAAASAALLNHELNRVNGQTVDLDRSTTRLSDSAVAGSSSIDRYSGRLGVLVKTAAALGPALIPIGAVGIPAVTGLASQLGFATIAAGTAIAAFQGIGTALTAVNKADLEPTVKNLEAAHEALKQLSPAGRALVGQLTEMKPVLTELRDSAATSFFPGLIDGLETLERLAPSLDAILTTVGDTLGDLFAEGAESLTSSRWADFFEMIAREARPALTDMAHAVGDVVHGMSELWEAFMPLNRDFGGWLADAADGFDRWATGLSRTDGFKEFVAYLRENGPRVGEAMTAIANAVLQIVEAAAPLGGPVLDAIASFADAVATIADSPLGTPIMTAVTAMSALSLATNAATAATLRLKAAQATLGVGAGAPAKGATPAVVGGGLASGLAILGLLDTAPDYIKNLQMMADGERNVAEGLARMAAGANPVGAALNLLGVDVLGTKEGDGFVGAAWDAAQANLELERSMGATRDESRRFAHTFFDANLEMLRNARQSERLKAALKEQNQAIRASADGWLDFSQKVDLGDTSLETVIDRVRKLADAAANEAENIRTALRRGIDPKVIKSIYDTLGPQGAVLAIQQLAHVSKDKAADIAAPFDRLRDSRRGVVGAMKEVDEAINGTREKLRGLNNEHPKPTADLDDRPLRGRLASAERLLIGFDAKRPKPNADVDISDVQSGVASAERLLIGFDGDHAEATITITTIHRDVRVGNDTAGGPAPLGAGIADGGTVGGQRYPYGDKVPALLAPGEEVISNRFGQADRHRALLKAINANRLAEGGTARAVRMAAGSVSSGVVRHVVEVQVVGGEFDLTRARAQINGIAREISRDEIEQDRRFAESQRG